MVYEIDREIAVFDDVRNLPELITLYLRDEELRQSIARRGYERSLREHTAQGYLRRLLQQVQERQVGDP
jgi:spore maturation protein CgeB